MEIAIIGTIRVLGTLPVLRWAFVGRAGKADARLLCYNEPVNTYRFPVVIESDSDGFFAYCPDLQGCYTQGKTFEEALTNIRDAVRLHLEHRLSRGEATGPRLSS